MSKSSPQESFSDLTQRSFANHPTRAQAKFARIKKSGRKSRLAKAVRRAIEAEIFLRIEKNLLAIKILVEAIENRRNRLKQDSRQALQEIKSSQGRISSIFDRMVYRLYPEQVDSIARFIATTAKSCAQRRLPLSLLNDIQMPRIRYGSENDPVNMDANDVAEEAADESSLRRGKRDGWDEERRLRSREYYLFLASIYLNESVEEMWRILADEMEIRRLVKLLRVEVAEIENKAGHIYREKAVRKRLAVKKKWGWTNRLKVA
jgi:hypothetical protein